MATGTIIEFLNFLVRKENYSRPISRSLLIKPTMILFRKYTIATAYIGGGASLNFESKRKN